MIRAMISVVVPIYNERDNIEELYTQVSAALDSTGEAWELFLIDDGSRDGSFSVVGELARRDGRVKGLRHSRNFGQYAAVAAGIDHAAGDAIIVMDADLQEPASLIPRLVAKWRSGYKAVYTTATARQDSLLRRLSGAIFYNLFGRASFLGNVQNVSEMRLIDKEVAQAFRRLREKPRFIKGVFFWLGYRHVFVEYEKQKRAAGVSKYSFARLARLALDGIFSFSFAPLQAVTYSGFTVLFVSLVYGAFLAVASWTDPTRSFGSAPLVFVALFLGAVQLICLGIIGEYIGRIYDEVRQRPDYVIEERINAEPGISRLP